VVNTRKSKLFSAGKGILMIFKKIGAVSLVLAAFLSLLPVNASVNAEEQTSAFKQSYIIELNQNTPEIFQNDLGIISVSPVFVDSTFDKFQRTYEITSTYSLAEFKRTYFEKSAYIEPMLGVNAGAVTVNDPGFSSDPSNVDRQWGLLKSKFPEAWEKTTGSNSVTIAVIDTGIDSTHEDLSAGQVAAGFDLLNRSSIAFGVNSDDNGHGTLVAGVIGATANNFKGITGGNWQVTLMPLKALDNKGSGNSADIAAAIVWAADKGATIINMSLGGIGFGNDTTLSNAITYAFNKGVVLVAAAGNDVAVTGGDVDQNPVFPVCNDNGQNMVIGVVASDINDQKATFSNYGKNCVDVSAPGKRILSTINYEPGTGKYIQNGYAYASGTSLAAPFVSAEAALLKAFYPNASNKEIRERIIKSADSIDLLNLNQCNGLSCSGLIGSGRINALKAFDDSLILTLIAEGELVRSENDQVIYYVSDGFRQQVTPFVLKQRFANTPVKVLTASQIATLPIGSYALPIEGTLMKTASDPTVYSIINGYKRPLTFQVYLQRAITPSQINTVDDQELGIRITGTFLPPLEGTLVKSSSNPTVYWVVDGLLHPINYNFWVEKGLNIFPIMVMSSNDLKGYAQGNAYVR
jgi:hypothetical protein